MGVTFNDYSDEVLEAFNDACLRALERCGAQAEGYLLALDAGHGKYTAGKRCRKAIDPNETREWFLNDRVSRYIAERAAQYEGFRTIRVDDITGKVDVSHAERCRRANEAGADVYLSNHHNAGIDDGDDRVDDDAGGGLVAFCMRGGVEAKAIRDQLHEALIGSGALRGNRSAPCQEKNYNVLVYSNMPAVLIEYGFMDSVTDVPVILTEEYAKLCGYAVADWFARYWDLKLHEAPVPEDPVRFTDVARDAWYAEAVEYCAAQGLMIGNGEGTFEPNRPITRAEMAAVLMRMKK